MAKDILSSIQQHYAMWQERGIAGVSWEKSGLHQFNFLRVHGLQRYHKLLDIGCSCLRGGIHFIDYLDVGHYYGFDKEPELVGFAWEEIKKRNLESKKPTVETVNNFSMEIARDVMFDFMLAQSVFTHIKPNLVRLCFESILPHLKQNGKFFATIHEGDELNISEDRQPWRKTGDEMRQVFYPASYMREIAEYYGMEMTYIGQWASPSDGSNCRFCK